MPVSYFIICNTWSIPGINFISHFHFPGAFAPAGPSTIWKRRINFKDSTETRAYEMLMKDSAHDIVPEFFREVEYNGECILFLST